MRARIYALSLAASDEEMFSHFRFVPQCPSGKCRVYEIRFRFAGEEIDLSPPTCTTQYLNDLTDPELRGGAILLNRAQTRIDEFSFSTSYSIDRYDPVTWRL